MSDALREDGPIIEWGSASMAFDDDGDDGESGDLHVVVRFPNGALLAVIDGLGHGPEAALAAKSAARLLEADAHESVVALVERCHAGLRRTRGAVMNLASFSAADSSMTWIGIGNIEGVLVRADPTASRRREVIHARGGVVGYQLPPLRATSLSLSRGDTLIMATDGIRTAFASECVPARHPQEMADSIMAAHRRGSDDALVVVVKFVGGTA